MSQTEQIVTQPFDLSTLKSQLKIIFTFYSSFGDRTNFTSLKSNKFHKLMADANISDVAFSTKELDLLFVKQTNHQSNLSFAQFLDLLPKIGFAKYNTQQPKLAFEKLINSNLLPLYQSIMNETDLGSDVQQFHQEIQSPYTLFILEYISPVLLKIYLSYFPWEPKTCEKKSVLQEKSQTALMKLLKEYDICPNIMTKSTAYLLYTDIISTPTTLLSHNEKIKNIIYFLENDTGNVFTFSRFCAYLLRTAIIKINLQDQGELQTEDNDNIENAQSINEIEKLLILLNKMELSQGFQQLEKRTHNPHYSKITLLVPKEMIDEICKDIPKYHPHQPLSLHKQYIQFSPTGRSIIVKPEQQTNPPKQIPTLGEYLSSPGKNMLNVSSISLSKEYFQSLDLDANLCELLQFDSQSFPIIEKALGQLLKLFQFYSSQGEPLNIYQMKSSAFNRLMKDARLLKNDEEGQQQQQQPQPQSQNDNPKLETLSYTLNPRDIDLLFTKLTGTKMQQTIKQTLHSHDIKSPNLGYQSQYLPSQKGIKGKLEFEHFLKSIEIIAIRLYPSYLLQDSLLHLILNHFNRLYEQKSTLIESRAIGIQYIEQLMQLLNDQQMVELLGYTHKALMNFYKFYANQKNQLTIDKFFQFCKDFSIFPDVQSKSKLQRIFCALAQMHDQKQKQKLYQSSVDAQSQQNSQYQSRQNFGYQEHLMLDEHLFIEALALCAIDIQYQGEPQPTNIEKIITFLQRINQSQGPIKIQKMIGHTRAPSGISWDILVEIRRHFPNYFQISLAKQSLRENPQEKISFDQFVKANFS